MRLLGSYCLARLRRRPYALTVEVTRQCNARCQHCHCWELDPESELSSYDDVVRHFQPIVVWFTGGEPLLRKDLPQLVAGIRKVSPFAYLGMVTNGSVLTPNLAEDLSKAGLDQINISLDFIGPLHDEFRGIEGLYDHIEQLIPKIRNRGLSIVLATCIMEKNLDFLVPMVELASDWDVELGFSCYSALKTGNRDNMIGKAGIEKLEGIVEQLCRLKKERATIHSSYSFLRNIPEFFSRGSVGNCQATKSWLYMNPAGYLKICPDKEIYSYYKNYAGKLDIDCADCWYTCRGEMETPIFERILSGWEPPTVFRRRRA